ncbi:MAG: NAD(P)(+) transhydrogenase (Re/Si-specific) subunit alpha, partial [Burkholderiales bacterium]
MSLLIGVPREVFAGEKRVATVPEVVDKLVKLGFRVAVEAGAGDGAQISDDAYRAAGAEIVTGRAELWSSADIVFKVRARDTRHAVHRQHGGPARRELLQQRR